MNKQSKQDREDKKQNQWEIWFISSIIIFTAYFLVGAFPGSKIAFPSWPYFFVISIINLLICLYFGTKKS